ncbi:unnamed protein product [Arctia plantaginis]|uniref:Uncharacterized protein n=1 Tax=Arctia plantaginis TaxID=874455 RepID=A0A8S1AP33_ARCPL|nr:unnamed protein product [Arctia plantaginis]
MDNRAVIERIMRSLAYEVETNSNNEKIKERTNPSKLDELNVKIKVRKKEINQLYNRGFISNNQSEAQVVPQKVRIVTSDETIMSFDMFMEADEKVMTQKHRKPIFDRMKPGICLNARTDENNQPYMPESQGSPLSKSDEEVERPFKLYKNNYDTYRKSPKRIERTFLGTKCKPGGCLDPPFDEDTYSYEPPETAELRQHPGNTDIIDHQEKVLIDSKLYPKTPDKNKIQTKHTSISVDPVDDKVKKSGSIQNLSCMEPVKKTVIADPHKESEEGTYSYNPVLETSLTRDSYDIKISDHREDKSINSKLSPIAPHKSKRKSKDTSFSISPVNDDTDFIKKPVITYLPDDNKKALRTRISSQDKSKKSVDGSVNAFFVPPKGTKREFNDPVQRNSSKQLSYNPQSIKDKSEECLKLLALVEPLPIKTPSDHVSVGQNTGKISNKPLNIPFQPNKELLDANTNDTESSNLISDIEKISVVPINDEISLPNRDNINEEVTSSKILPNEHSKIPIENATQPEKDHVTNHKPESNTNKEKINETFDKVESFIDQSPDKGKIMSTKDKIDMAIQRKYDEEQTVTIEKEPEIQNQMHNIKSPKIHTTSNVSDNIYQHFDLDNNIANITTAKDVDPLSFLEQKPKSGSNILETFEENADLNKNDMDTNFADENNTLDHIIQPIMNPLAKEIFEEPHEVSLFSDSKSQYSDLDNKITNFTNGEDIHLISVLEQKPESENNVLEIFEENADVNVNTMDSDIVDTFSDENKTLDDRTLQITKLKAEEVFEKQHKDSDVPDSMSEPFNLDNAMDSNTVDMLSDENKTSEDRRLQIKDPKPKEIFEQPQVAYPGGVSTLTIEQHNKVIDEEEQKANDIQAQAIDVKLSPSQILVTENSASDTLTQKQKIIDAFLDTHKKDMRDKDEDLSGGQAQDVTSVRLSDDSVVTSDLKTISLNLAFHTYLKNKNERIFKTILNDNDIYRYPNDSITVITSQIKVSSNENLPELNIPIDPMFNIAIKIKSNEQDQKPKHDFDTVLDKTKTKPINTFPASAKTLDTKPKSKSVEQRIRNQQDQNDTALHRTLTDIYEQELVPLQTMIRSLKTDIDSLAEQRTFLKTKVICSKKSFHRKRN